MRRAEIHQRPPADRARSRRPVIAALTVCLCCPWVAAAQTMPAPPAAPSPPAISSSAAAPKPPDLSKEAVAFDKLYTKVREEADGTGTRETTARIRILADAGVKAMAVLAFTYTASNQQIDIAYVRVIKPDGSIVATPDYNIQDLPADVSQQAPMYSDIHQKHVAVRGLGVGDTLEYQMTLRTLKPDVPGQFWLEYTFEKNLIVLDEQLDLDVPADKQVMVASADVQPAITTTDGRKHYHWASANLARPDPDAPPPSAKKWKPSVQVTTFTSWEQIGAWYASLQKDALTVTPAIKAHADTLTKGLTTDEDKVRAIFNDVALHVHYVALEFGIGRYQPHPADDVLSNEYGDCKDKHTLLAALLRAEGIESWPVLISSGRYLDPATPSPAQFDHVITLVPLSGKLLWMDSTEEVSPLGVLAGTLRDKQALAVPVAKAAYLEHTPPDLPFAQSARFDVAGKLSDQGTFTAHFVETYHGDAELIFRAAFRGVPQSQWKEFLQGVSNAIGFAGEVAAPEVSPVEQTAQPLQFSFDYTREKFGEWDSRRISPPFPPLGWELAPGVKQIKPADDIDIGSPGDEVYTATIAIPYGWLLFPPQAVDIIEDWAEYHAKYSFQGETFTAERRLVIKKDKVPLADWDKYLAFRRGIYNDEERMEPVHSPSMVAAASPSGLDSAYSFLLLQRQAIVDAIKPLQDAASILEAEPPASPDDLLKATGKLNAALEAIETQSRALAADDPHSLYWAQALDFAWCVKGWASLESRDLANADSYLHAAWRLHPDYISGLLLGLLLEAKNDKAAAAHQYELAHVSANPGAFGISLSQGFDADEKIAKKISESYKRTTGRELTATALGQHNEYKGSLEEERDRISEVHSFIHVTKLTGSGLYSVAFEAGRPVKAIFLGGDKDFASLVPALETHAYAPQLPAGSKARLLREVRLICTPWAGCDASFLLPNSIELPSNTNKIKVINVTPATATSGLKTIQIEKLPVAPPQ